MTESSPFLPGPDFDRDLNLEELLVGVDRDKLPKAIGGMLETNIRILSMDGNVLIGEKKFEADKRVPLRVEIETVGYLEAEGGKGEELEAAAELVQLVLRCSARYLMTSALHHEAVQNDYEELQKKHQALLESECRYRELAGNLEQRVTGQVKAIERAQLCLYEAERMASVGHLAAGVAHEINNPIGFITSNLNTARSYVEKLATYAEKVRAAGTNATLASYWNEHELDDLLEDFQLLLQESVVGAERVARIVKDLKGFSNVDRSKEEIIDINEVIQSASNIAKQEIGQQVELTLDLGSLRPIRCQPGYLSQVFLNIMLNAKQATKLRGRIVVKTSLEGQRIRVTFTDSGEGIAEDVLPHIFDPFFTTRAVGQGTGLGLTVSRDVVLQHSGEIKVESKPGEGTTVTLWLPITDK